MTGVLEVLVSIASFIVGLAVAHLYWLVCDAIRAYTNKTERADR